MNERDDASQGRRIFLAAATAVAGSAALGSAPAVAMSSRYASSLRMKAEGNVPLEWVLALLPLDVSWLPPNSLFKAKYEFPSPTYAGKDVMRLHIYVLVGGDPNNRLDVSILNTTVEDIVLEQAASGGPDNPANNVVMSGRVASIEWVSPFGDLTGRAFMTGFGFDWLDAQRSSAKFKVVAGSAAGSHVTVMPEAEGFIEIKRPWQSY